MAKQLKNLPKIDRNPLLVLDIVEELRLHAENVAKEAAESGKPNSARGRLLKIRAFAGDLERIANAKIGSHEDDINKS